MNHKIINVFIGLLFLLLLTSLVSAVDVDYDVVKAINSGKEVKVIVTLEDEPLPVTSENSNGITTLDAKKEKLELRKEMIKKTQNSVLSDLLPPGNTKKIDQKKIKSLNTNSEENDFQLGFQYNTINGFSGKIGQKSFQKLLSNPKIKKISLDKEVKISLDNSVPLINADKVTSLAFNGININGTGETVCVIDTGIDYTHPALGGCTNNTFMGGTCRKVIGGYDIADDDNDPIDSNSHGTHVAGIVASENGTYRGVAPGAKLVAMKVFSGSSGSTDSSYIIAGIDWCKNNATIFNISVITLSLGDGTENNGYCDNDSMASAVNSAVDQGIFVDVSSGNDGFSAGISSPACASNATSVGRTDNNDDIAASSNGGAILDLLAPGSSITSSLPGSTYGQKSGTSMSSPHVAGAAAILRQYGKLVYNTNLTPLWMESKLKISGKPILDSRNNNVTSRIDVLKAVQPYINFTSDSTANATTLAVTFAFINISSDVNLTHALLEWNHSNGTIINLTMISSNETNFYYNLSGLNNTNHTYKIFGNDSANTFGVSETRFVSVDYTPPQITFTTPANNSYLKDAFSLNVSLSDTQLSYSNYTITNSSSAVVQTNVHGNINAPIYSWSDLINIFNLTFSDDNYTLTVFANDSLGNAQSSSLIFVVDKTYPSFSSLEKTPLTVYNNDTVIFRINATDLYLNQSSIFFSTNVSGSYVNYTMDLESGDKYNITLSGRSNLSNQNNVSYQFFVADYAGNINYTERYSWVVQNRVPINLNVVFPNNNTVIEVGNSSQFNASAFDPDSDALTYRWNFTDGTSLSTGQNVTHQFATLDNYTLILNASDSYSSNSSTLRIIVNDTAPPNLNSISYDNEVHLQADGDNQTVTATIFDYSGISNSSVYFNSIKQAGVCTQSSTTWTCKWSWGNLFVGTYSFSINNTDNFKSLHSNSTLYSFSVTSCSDSVKNGDETGVDCGGSCSACPNSGSSDSSGGSGGGSGGGANVVSTSSTPSNSGTSTESASASSSESSGSGRIAPETPAPPPEPVKFSQSVSLNKGKQSMIALDNPGISIKKLEIQSKTDKEVVFEVISLVQKPEEVPELKNPFQYLEINMNLTSKEFKKAKVTFKITKSWLNQNNYLKETVALNTFEKGEWKELSTQFAVEEEEEYNYESNLDHFSYFAITAKSEMELSWWKTLIPPKFGTKEFVFFGIIIVIALLFMVYWLVRERD